MQCLVFSIYLQLNIKLFNIKKSLPNLRSLIGKINVRYAITYDDIYFIDGKHYGNSIINCSRILAKDTLDRFLMDENTYDWFDENINGLETLSQIDRDSLDKLSFISKNDKKNSNLFPKKLSGVVHPFISANISSIGTITSKNTSLAIYSLHSQVYLVSNHLQRENKFHIVTCSLGNLNIKGIND